MTGQREFLLLCLCCYYAKNKAALIYLSYPGGVYSRTRVLEKVQKGFMRELEKYGTDYTDIALIHCVDENRDFDKVMDNGIFDYMLRLKREGVVRSVGFASHNIKICKRFLETGLIVTIPFLAHCRARICGAPASTVTTVSHVPKGSILAWSINIRI